MASSKKHFVLGSSQVKLSGKPPLCSVDLLRVNNGLEVKKRNLWCARRPSGSVAVSEEINLLDCCFSKHLGQLLDRDTSEPLPLSPVIIG